MDVSCVLACDPHFGGVGLGDTLDSVTEAEAKEAFWAAVRDWDPSSMEVAQDIAIDHGFKLWRLGVEENEGVVRASSLGENIPGGVFSIDDNYETYWIVTGNRSPFAVELFISYRGYAHNAGMWLRDLNRDGNKTLAQAHRFGAMKAWAALAALKAVGPGVSPVRDAMTRVNAMLAGSFELDRERAIPPEINPARPDAVAAFWAAMRDWDPVSMDIAKDIAIDNDLHLWKLGIENLRAHFPEDEPESGMFDIDGHAEVTWLVKDREDIRGPEDRYVVEMFVTYRDESWLQRWGWGTLVAAPQGSLVPNVITAHRVGAERAWIVMMAMKNIGPQGSHEQVQAEIRRLASHHAHPLVVVPPEINPPRLPVSRLEHHMTMKPNPAWLTTTLAEYYPFLQEKVPAEWLPKLDDAKGKGGRISARMQELGCGAYGCVLPTLDASVVLKATTDTTEVQFASELGKTLVVPIVVEYFMVIALSAKHHGNRVSLLWRESAQDVGDIDVALPKNQGPAAEHAITRQHEAAKRILLALKDGVRSMKVLEVMFGQWVATLDQMAEIPPLRYVATGMKRVWLEQKIFISDVHAGNLGRCKRGGKMEWVITDPGNVVVVE